MTLTGILRFLYLAIIIFVMFRCFVCESSFADNKQLVAHIQLSHVNLTTFRCAESDCSRAYSKFNSYKKHRFFKHEILQKQTVEFKKAEKLSVETLEITNAEDIQESLNLLDETDDSSDTSSDASDVIFEDQDIFWEFSDTLDENCLKDCQFKEKCLHFFAKLYKFPDISRIRVDEIGHDVMTLVHNQCDDIRKEIHNRATQLGTDSISVTEIDSIFKKKLEPFDALSTESRRFSTYKKLGTFIPPQSYALGNQKVPVEKEGKMELVDKVIVSQFIPIREVFKKFFEMPNVLESTLQYLKNAEKHSTIVKNIVQGSLWKEKSKIYDDKIVLPLVMFFDDYENNNPLGSHKGVSKCGACYLNIPVLPPEFQAKIENIFLFILFNTKSRAVFHNKKIFSKAIEEINSLQSEGIPVIINNEEIRIYFLLTLIIGDNLGLHGILGFTESFSANFFCRFCLTEHKNISKIFNERDCILRDKKNYESLLSQKNASRSGLKETCVFNEVDYYHVTQNTAVDPQHDLLEGVCRYDVALVLYYFIYIMKLFSLQDFNDRLKSFMYGSNDNENKPPPILEKHLKKKCIIMSASEMLSLIRNILLIIESTKSVSEDNKQWLLLKKLKQIVDIAFSKTVHEKTYVSLDNLIEEYLKLHSEIFPGKMKPKHHFLIHYARILEALGILNVSTCMRFESKHQEGKVTSHVSRCRINVCRTIAIKHQLILNYRFLSKHCSYPLFTSGTIKQVALTQISESNEFISLLSHSNGSIKKTQWIKYLGRKIKVNSIIVVPSEEGPLFHVVHVINIIEKYDCRIITKKLNDVFFDNHLQAFQVFDDNNYSWDMLKLCNLQDVTITVRNKLPNGCHYICKSWL